jgi:E3 ubiquitin-protein ligase HUWE1
MIITILGNEEVQLFGQQPGNTVPPPELTTHPLLLDAAASSRQGSGQDRTSRRPRQHPHPHSHVPQDLLQTVGDLIGGGAVQLFQHIMTRGRGGIPEAIQIGVPGEAFINIDRFGGSRRPHGTVSAAFRMERGSRSSDNRTGDGKQGERGLTPLLTSQRWSEEAKILNGKWVQDRASALTNHVVLRLLPGAVKEAALKAEAEAQKNEEEDQAENKIVSDPDERADTVAVEASNDPSGNAVLDEGSPSVADPAPAATAPTTADTIEQETIIADPTQVILGSLTDILAAATAAVEQNADTMMNDENPQPSADPIEGEPPEQAEPTASTSAETESRPPERITVMIHGNEVDITDTGIDPTFLEALPDDMREEVLNQHVREQRAARIERPADSQISAEFLDALPPEIRAEIIQQERMEAARRQQQTSTSAPVPTEIDPASFIASLEPQLRQDVLLDSDERFLASLPSHMLAEAGGFRGASRRALSRHPEDPAHAARSQQGNKKPPANRDAIHLLDKSGVALLIRLLFFPQVLKKTLLFRVLLNLCENTKTRIELFNLLLGILQDGTGDLAAIDKSFQQLSFRSPKTPTQRTPKTPSKGRSGSDYFGTSAVSITRDDPAPDLVVQRCLEALSFIVTSNEKSSLFFLSEHDIPAGLKKLPPSKKGKGKEGTSPQTHFPIVLLLNLLSRHSLLKTSSIVESIVSLLAIVTRPLLNLKSSDKEQPTPQKSTDDSATQAPSSSADPATVPPSTVNEPDTTINSKYQVGMLKQ